MSRVLRVPTPARHHVSRSVPPPVSAHLASCVEEAQAPTQRRHRGPTGRGGRSRVATIQRSTIRYAVHLNGLGNHSMYIFVRLKRVERAKHVTCSSKKKGNIFYDKVAESLPLINVSSYRMWKKANSGLFLNISLCKWFCPVSIYGYVVWLDLLPQATFIFCDQSCIWHQTLSTVRCFSAR